MLYKLTHMTHLTPNEQVLVDYMVQHASEVITLTSKELSDVSFVSVATIYRLLGKLSLSGFTEFKVALAASLKQQEQLTPINPNFPIIKTDSTDKVIQQMTQLYVHTLDDTTHLTNPDNLDEVVSALLSAKMIDVYAAAGNIHFAKNFQFQLQEIGICCTVPEEDYVQHLTAANSTKENIAIIVSFGGRSMSSREVIRMLKQNKTPIILITSTQGNPLVSQADFLLYLASKENHYNKISSFSTRYSLLIVFDLIYSTIFNRQPEKYYQYKLKNYEKMNQQLT